MEPIQRVAFTGLRTMGYDEAWAVGAPAGSDFSPQRTESTTPGSSCTMTGSRTGIHDGEIICSIVEETYGLSQSAPGYVCNYIVAHQSGETSTQIDTGAVRCATGWPDGGTASEYLRDWKVVAQSFSFPDAADAHSRVDGFFIISIKREAIFRDHIFQGSTYALSSTAVLNLPWYNKSGNLEMWITEDPDPGDDDPNDEDDPADEDGGDGDHTPTYDPIPVPYAPTQGAATAGFVTLYKLHQGIMSQFASDCFASTIWEALKQFFSNPMDFLVGVNLVPFDPPAGGSMKPSYGVVSFAHAYPVITNQYVDIDCGYVDITKYWGSCFDFEPYTKIQIWLPYIGYRDLPVDEIMGKAIHVKYRCDCLTGDCVAFVYLGAGSAVGPVIEQVISQFYGNCAVRVPFGSVSYDSAISNSIALMGAAASGGLTAGFGAAADGGGVVGGLAAGVNGAGEALVTSNGSKAASVGVVQGLKPNIHKGGAAGGSTGYMSIQKPYIIRRMPRQNLPEGYKNLKGYPSNIGGKLADFSGLAVVDDIQLNNIPAMEDERKEIMQWLRGGVLL